MFDYIGYLRKVSRVLLKICLSKNYNVILATFKSGKNYSTFMHYDNICIPDTNKNQVFPTPTGI